MKLDVSERLKNIENCYQHAKSAIDNRLNSEGYVIIDEQYHAESFGSRFIIWSNKTDAIRLIWDGKNDWFWLEKTNTPPFNWRADWKTLIYIPYLREHDIGYANNIPAKIIAMLD